MSTPTMTPIPPPYPVRVHHYLPSSSSSSSSSSSPPHPVQAYEHLVLASSSAEERAANALVFVGGLGDGPHTIPYVRRLAEYLASFSSSSPSSPFSPPSSAPPASSSAAAAAASAAAASDTSVDACAPRYAVFEARLSSAHSAFGYASLAQDAREIADLVRYLRREGRVGRAGRVVLVGHSTGCQDVLEFATKMRGGVGDGVGDGVGEGQTEGDEEARVDGYVLQGPVSDREAIGLGEDPAEVEAALAVAERMLEEGRGGEVMEKRLLPKGWRGIPVTAYRWRSLAGVGGDDDYFSSDLPDEKLAAVWGRLEKPVLILPSEKDEWVPPSVDVARLVDRWKSFCKPGIASELSGLIPGADHRVGNDAGQEWLAHRVAQFLANLEKQ